MLLHPPDELITPTDDETLPAVNALFCSLWLITTSQSPPLSPNSVAI